MCRIPTFCFQTPRTSKSEHRQHNILNVYTAHTHDTLSQTNTRRLNRHSIIALHLHDLACSPSHRRSHPPPDHFSYLIDKPSCGKYTGISDTGVITSHCSRIRARSSDHGLASPPKIWARSRITSSWARVKRNHQSTSSL